MKTITIPLLTIALLAGSASKAQTVIKDAWVRGTVPQQRATGLFAQITSATDGRLVSGTSPVATHVEIHEMSMEGNVMRMRALPDGLALPAGKVVDLKPGGYHVMLLGLKQPLKEGDSVPLTLVIQRKDGRQEAVEFKAPVRALSTPGMSHKH